MALEFKTLSDLLAHGFGDVIDARSPAEFAIDHIPGAINLPVLSNEERAEIGTIYVQDSPFKARKMGAALVFQNAARHIAGPLSDRDGGWKPLVYCWRGGQRSGSFGWMLGQIGWRSKVIAGGYQTYRRLVYQALYETPIGHDIILLDGNTGTAKTELLHILKSRGVQVLDLEGMAKHRGSLLGEMPGGQPAQKAFESDIAVTLAGLDSNQSVLIEAESNKIGDRIIPPTLWQAMKVAPRIEIQASVDARTNYLVRDYDDILSDTVRLKDRLLPLIAFRGHDVVAHWFELLDQGNKSDLTRALIEQHYDRAYAKSRATVSAEIMASVKANNLDRMGLEDVADQIEAVVRSRSI